MRLHVAIRLHLVTRALLLEGVTLYTCHSAMSVVCPVVRDRTHPPTQNMISGQLRQFKKKKKFYCLFHPKKCFHLQYFFPIYTFLCICGCFMPSWVGEASRPTMLLSMEANYCGHTGCTSTRTPSQTRTVLGNAMDVRCGPGFTPTKNVASRIYVLRLWCKSSGWWTLFDA